MKFTARLTLTFLLLLGLSAAPSHAEQEVKNKQLIYCLASHSSIPQNQLDDFAVDYMLQRDGSIRISIFRESAEGIPLKAWTLKRAGKTSTSFAWNGMLKGDLIQPGEYVIRFTSLGRTEETIELPLEVLPAQERLPLQLTRGGDYLPLTEDIQSVWQAVTAPIAVADTGDLSHEPLLDSPGGKAIGTVHGQTAGVIIRELLDDGWAKIGAWATEDGSYIEGYIRQDRLKMIQPNPRFGLVIDKQAQTLSLYEADESAEAGARLIGSLRVSTGLMAPGKLFRETRAGAFILQKRIRSFTSEGYRYDYAIRIDGGNLIHELGHRVANGEKDFSSQTPALGSKASQGCVRVDPETNAQGLDAAWLWHHLPRGTKVLVLDDPQARMSMLEEIGEFPPLASAAQPAQVVTADDALPLAGNETQQPPQTAQEIILPQPEREGPARLIMTFTGDCILGSEEKSRKLPESFDSFIAEKGFSWPFSGLYDLLSADDLSIINLEGVLKDDTRGRQDGKLHWFRGPTSFAGILPAGSIELAGLANNHMRDYGIAGHNSTREALKAAGIPYFGYGDTYIHEHQGLKIGFSGIRETIWRQKPGLPGEEIAALKEAGCDYIVYTIHAGKEYSRTHNELQEKIARSVIDAGADIVIGMHPHVVQGIEKYNGGLIVYSLGNFSFGGNLKLTEFDGLAVQVILDFEDRELKETTLKLIPLLTSGTEPANDFRPIPALGEDKERILELVQNDSPELKIEEIMRFKR